MSIIDNNILTQDYWNPVKWEFYFSDLPDIKYFVKSVTLPQIKFTHETMNTGQKYITGYEPEEEFSIEFLETEDFKLIGYLASWRNTIFNKYSRVFNIGNHTKNGTLVLENSGNGLTYLFKNMLFLGLDNIDLDYESGEGKTISATFSADTID